MRSFHRRHHRWLRHLPRRRHLKNGWLHRLLGERLFAPELWKPSRRSIAGGLALGLFIGFTPTMGAQIVLGGICAYFLRVNVPLAIAGSLVTNPFTAPIVYPLEYQLGILLVGVAEPSELQGYTGVLYNFVRHAKPLWIGSLLIGGIAAAISYALVTLLWKEATHLRDLRQHRKAEAQARPEAGHKAVTETGSSET